MAEGDRDAYRRQQAALAREREIMKDVPGWEVGPAFNNRETRDADVAMAQLLAALIEQAGKSTYNSKKYHVPEIVIL